MVVSAVSVHGGDEGVAGGGPEGVGLQFVLIHYFGSFFIDFGLFEQTGS